jgi:hypothetical protein
MQIERLTVTARKAGGNNMNANRAPEIVMKRRKRDSNEP